MYQQVKNVNPLIAACLLFVALLWNCRQNNPVAPPDLIAPTDLQIDAAGDQKVRLKWNYQEQANGFRIERKSGDEFSLMGIIAGTQRSFVDTNGVLLFQNYVYRVAAISGNTIGPWAEKEFRFFEFMGPSNLSIEFISDRAAELSWKDNSNFEQGFTLEYRQGNYAYQPVAALAANTTAYTHPALFKKDSTYSYRLRAFTPLNASYWLEKQAPFTFSAPMKLQSTHLSINSMQLHWQENNLLESGFKIERRTGNGTFAEIAAVSKNITFYIDNTVDSAQTYEYRVRAFAAHNFSDYSPALRVVYGIARFKHLRQFYHPYWIRGLAFSGNGEFTASAGEDSKIMLWPTESGTAPRTLSGHTKIVTAVAFSPDGKTLASCSIDSTIKFWNVSDGRLLRSWREHKNGVNSIAYTPDGQMFASGDAGGQLKLWRISDGTVLQTIMNSGRITKLAFHPNQRILAYAVSGPSSNYIMFWNITNGLKQHSDLLSGSPIMVMAYSPNGEMFAHVLHGVHTLLLKMLDDFRVQLLGSFGGESFPGMTFTFSPDSEILSISETPGVSFWRLRYPNSLAIKFKESFGSAGMAFSQNGKYFVIGDLGGVINLLQLTKEWAAIN